ncbi:MAG: hypothetical protein FWD77_01860, partial [Betaproteobacteria bacterium]|nr:hypothetical protein [Betaproteobacteria bacterium]
GLFCNVRVHLDGSGQWSLLAADVCPPSASANDSYNLATGMLSLPHINIPGLGEFINVSARLDANTWRWQLLGADPAGGSGNTGGGGIAACFSADSPVTYAVSGATYASTTVRPDTYEGRPAISNTQYNANGSIYSVNYTEITSSDVLQPATVIGNGAMTLSYTPTYVRARLSMQPGQSFDQRATMSTGITYDIHTNFVGYETLTLAGKTFSNVCHFIETQVGGGASVKTEFWMAHGYGPIKVNSIQYAGEL